MTTIATKGFIKPFYWMNNTDYLTKNKALFFPSQPRTEQYVGAKTRSPCFTLVEFVSDISYSDDYDPNMKSESYLLIWVA